MNRHFIIGFYFITFLMGFSFIIFDLFLWLYHRKKTLKYLLLSALALTMILLEQMVTAYDTINTVYSRIENAVLINISSIGYVMMIFALTKLVHLLLNKSIPKSLECLLGILSMIPFIFANIYLLTNLRVFLWASNILLFGVVFYNIILLLIHSNKITNQVLRNVTGWISVVSLLMLPLLFLDTLIEKLPEIGDHFSLGLFSVLAYYFLISSIGLFCLIKYHSIFLSIPVKASKPEIMVDISLRMKEFNITSREKEIILLLIAGDSYQDICNKLVISLPTVKTHVHNIYKKLNVKNKVGLIHLLTAANI